MSGLYNTLFGHHSNAELLLRVLGLTKNDIPRYRSCYWNGEYIVIHTRTGGGNREEYEDGNDWLTEQPGYSYDEDDEYDCTYANFYFLPPPQSAEALKALPPETTPAEQWGALFKALEDSKPADRGGVAPGG